MLRYLVLAALLVAGMPASAAELSGVQMADTKDADGTRLLLNGLALRTYSFLKIHIYVAALYLEHPSHDPAEILDSPHPKLLQFNFLRDIAQWQARRSWRDSLGNACRPPCSLPAQSIDRFVGAIPAMRAGDVSTFLFDSHGLDIALNGRTLGHVDDPAFIHVVLSTFIGDHPTAPDVKRALLGSPG